MKNNAYKGTRIHWSKSQTHIVQLLNKRGIFDTRFTNLKDKFVLEFVVLNVVEVSKPVAVRMIIPIKGSDNEIKRQKELNFVHRILFHRIKEKFVGIDNGLVELTKEFMADLVVLDINGNSSTVGQLVLPQYKKNLEQGEQGEFKLLPEGK